MAATKVPVVRGSMPPCTMLSAIARDLSVASLETSVGFSVTAFSVSAIVAQNAGLSVSAEKAAAVTDDRVSTSRLRVFLRSSCSFLAAASCASCAAVCPTWSSSLAAESAAALVGAAVGAPCFFSANSALFSERASPCASWLISFVFPVAVAPARRPAPALQAHAHAQATRYMCQPIRDGAFVCDRFGRKNIVFQVRSVFCLLSLV